MTISRALLRALATAHVDTITVADTWAAGDTVTITINTRAFVITIGSLVTTTQVATTIKQALNGEDFTDTTASCFPTIDDDGAQGIPEFTDLEATVSGSVVTITAQTAGVPHTITCAEDTAGTGTATLANDTVASGPNFYNNVNNWTEGSVPAAADDVYVDNTDESILYGLSNAGATLTSMHFGASYSGYVGLPKENADGYTEYRADYLAIDVTTLKIGEGEGQGSGRIKIDCGSVQTTVEQIKSGSPAENGLPATIWKGSNASNVVNVKDGSFGAAVYGGETATIATLRQSGGSVFCGAGVTLTTVVKDGGSAVLNSAATTITNADGDMAIYGSGAITTLNATGGTVNSNTSGTITTANVGGRGAATLDFSNDPTPRTVSTLALDVGADVAWVPGTMTFTAITVSTRASRIRVE